MNTASTVSLGGSGFRDAVADAMAVSCNGPRGETREFSLGVKSTSGPTLDVFLVQGPGDKSICPWFGDERGDTVLVVCNKGGALVFACVGDGKPPFETRDIAEATRWFNHTADELTVALRRVVAAARAA